MKYNIIHWLICLVSLFILTSCEDVEHQMQGHENHEGHVIKQDDASMSLFKEGSLYQVGSSWTTQDADAIVLGDLKGQFVVVAMTYTRCEFSCPLIVADMKAIKQAVPARDQRNVRMVLITLDPERDQPEVMKAFATKNKLLPEQWTLLRGTADDVMEMAALLGVRYKKMPDGEFSHANIITILDPEGEMVYQQNGLGVQMTTETSKALSVFLAESG